MKTTSPNRRQFVKQAGITLAATSLMGPLACQAQEDMTIQQAIDKILAEIPGDRNPQTVDTVKSSDASQKLTGIVSTCMATVDVILEAIEKKANLIITHEPTFFNHRDEVDWLENDPVYLYKRNLLEENKIVVWRFHDYWHQDEPDGILQGFINAMAWQGFLNSKIENSVIIPQMTMAELANLMKHKLNLVRTFYVGDGDLKCTHVGLLPGSWGREKHISLLRKDIEVLVIGEANEWETIEYVRDAHLAGIKKGLIVLGHIMSEEPGMFYLIDWLKFVVPEVPAYHVAAKDPFVPV